MEIREEEKIAEEFKKSSKNTMAELLMGQIQIETPGREKKAHENNWAGSLTQGLQNIPQRTAEEPESGPFGQNIYDSSLFLTSLTPNHQFP